LRALITRQARTVENPKSGLLKICARLLKPVHTPRIQSDAASFITLLAYRKRLPSQSNKALKVQLVGFAQAINPRAEQNFTP
jgi:hypothetical protein